MNTVLVASKLASVFPSPHIWKVGSIVDQPEVKLTNWEIKQMKEGQYFVGNEVGASGRVSTAIRTYDPETKKGITASGRVYQLLGEPGRSMNGEYVWGYYKQVNNLTEIDEDLVKKQDAIQLVGSFVNPE